MDKHYLCPVVFGARFVVEKGKLSGHADNWFFVFHVISAWQFDGDLLGDAASSSQPLTYSG